MTRAIVTAAALTVALLVAAPARATAQAESGVELGVRLGYAFPAGNVGTPPNDVDRSLGDYVNGQVRSQKPLASAQFSLRRTFRPGLWAAANINYYTGGRTNVGGAFKQDFQANSRAGATVSFPFSSRNSVRVAVSQGAYTTIGADFLGLSASFQQVF